MTDKMTVADVAAELKITPARVGVLIKQGRLKAVHFGNQWMIDPADLDAVRIRKWGKPAKVK
jgi:excisionase family DNA binding protein